MDSEQEYFNPSGEMHYDKQEDHYVLRIFYNSRVRGSTPIPSPLAMGAWEVYEDEFWDKRLSREELGWVRRLTPWI